MPATTRPGTAPLEAVLVFPLLVGLVVFVVWVGSCGAERAAALSEVRGRVWADRDSADPGDLLRLEDDPTRGTVERRLTVVLPRRPGGGRPTLEVRAVAQFGGRAADANLFPDPSADDIAPHRDTLARLIAGNPDTLGHLAGRLAELDAVRFLAPRPAIE